MASKKEPYVVVIGGINIDIKGQPHRKLRPKDSNPGTVRMTIGGVACNVARNLNFSGAKVVLLGATGNDALGEYLRQELESEGINSKKLLKVKKQPTSSYLFMNDARGNMVFGVSDMEICEQITPAYVEKHLTTINGAAVVVADTNLPEDTLLYLAEHCEVPLFVDPVSVAKADKVLPILKYIHTITPNLAEGEYLSGVKPRAFEELADVAFFFLDRGVQYVALTMGKKGVFYTNDDHGFEAFPPAADVVNTTGAGDAFMAGLAYGYLMGYDEDRTVEFAQMKAAGTTETEDTVYVPPKWKRR